MQKRAPQQDIMQPYQNITQSQQFCNPCLNTLVEFLTDPKCRHVESRIAMVDFFTEGRICAVVRIDENTLTELLGHFQHKQIKDVSTAFSVSSEVDAKPYSAQPSFRAFVVENVSRSIISTLGTQLKVDPLFFASHVHTTWNDSDTQTPDLAMLPSRANPNRHINIHYHRTVLFGKTASSRVRLLRNGNLDRKVVVLPWSRNKRVGILQHCASVLHVPGEQYDIGLILVDPPVTDDYLIINEEALDTERINLSQKLFLGGYEDFSDPPPAGHSSRYHIKPTKTGLFDDLLSYWNQQYRPSLSSILDSRRSARLADFAYIPLRVIAAEWTNYVAVMHKSVKHYEYTSSAEVSFFEELQRLNSDLQALQTWRRRSMSSQLKLRAVIRHLEHWDKSERIWLSQTISSSHASKEEGCDREWRGDNTLLLEDFRYLNDKVSGLGSQLERMIPIVASLVQVVDSRRSLAETENISRLTVLALVFVPLSYVSSLFSMDASHGPGGPDFWVYFVVAVPVTIVVFLAAGPPWRSLGKLKILTAQNNKCSKDRSQTESYLSEGEKETV